MDRPKVMTRLPARGQRQVRGVIRDACFLIVGNTAFDTGSFSAILDGDSTWDEEDRHY